MGCCHVFTNTQLPTPNVPQHGEEWAGSFSPSSDVHWVEARDIPTEADR